MKNALSCQVVSLLLCSVWLVCTGLANADNNQAKVALLAPGYGALEFTAPLPGTYQLPALGVAADGDVLDSQGLPVRLHALMGDKITLLSFIYTTCSDVNGCPLATAVFHRIKNRLKQDPILAEQLRLLTLSFNPVHDTPEQMRSYAESFQEQGVDWRFLTTQSEHELQPILQAYQQNIQKQYNQQGQFIGTFSHILRVYLIAKNKQIRNIYNVSFLHPDTLINDVKTLLQADQKLTDQTPIVFKKTDHYDGNLYAPGDDKFAYEQADYQTQSQALSGRIGQPANLMDLIKQPPLGLPAVPIPEDNPVTKEKISLGKKLFYDRRLSLNNTFSCAMCHVPEQGFTSNEMATAVGIEGRTVRRNSPTLYNVAYLTKLFHDGRENSLEQQVWAPLLATNEMGNPSIATVIDKIKNSLDYQGLFELAFGTGPTMATVGMAIASYERTLNSANSAFDQWHFGHQKNAISLAAQQGYELFKGKAQCGNCHTIAAAYALFTDNKMHNTGLGYQQSMAKEPKQQRVQVAPGVFLNVASRLINSVAEKKVNDLGLYEVTQNPEDRWKYKTPSLRNIVLTAPYMHNGSFSTLQQVIEFYNQGGVVNDNLDALIKPLNLSLVEKNNLVEFLKTLTGDNISELVSDAFSVPVGDP